jgi:hypothetical protein
MIKNLFGEHESQCGRYFVKKGIDELEWMFSGKKKTEWRLYFKDGSSPRVEIFYGKTYRECKKALSKHQTSEGKR